MFFGSTRIGCCSRRKLVAVAAVWALARAPPTATALAARQHRIAFKRRVLPEKSIYARPLLRTGSDAGIGQQSNRTAIRDTDDHVRLMNVPARSSLTACSSSSRVFITIGPYHATGSWIGFPEIR